MRTHSLREELLRSTQYELVEQRTLMTAQPIGDFWLDEIQESAAASSVTTLGAYDFTGLAYAKTSYGFSGGGQTVAVIDSGIAYDHPALGGGFGTGYRVVGGWDFTEENDANPYDDGPGGSHGTHVAGIIGSTDLASPGVASGVDLVSLRVFNDSGAGQFSWVEKALKWVHDNRNAFRNPITAVNLSLGATWNSTTIPSWTTLEDEFAQLKADGIFIAVAAGNSFASYNTPGLSYPAASSYVVPVSSVDSGGNLSDFSQRQDRAIAAPGRSIRSTVPDYVGNLNRKTDDFATYSGTSMAAPYVAGASVLLRQALQFAGFTNITQDTIYNIMRNTADTIFDAVTQQSYKRLNLGRAIDSVMPADDYGSTMATAYNLANLSTRTFAGVVGKLDDRDYFTFTATDTGIAKFTATATGELRTGWELAGGGGTVSADGGTFTFDVIAGRTYTMGLSTRAGLGRYSIDASITPTLVNLGTVDARLITGISTAQGDRWYSFTAARDGILTTEALFAHASGNIDLEIYNASNQLIASSIGTSNNERLDLAARAGDQFTIRIRGSNERVDLRITNLVSLTGTQLSVAGTSANDTISLVAGANHLLTVNGTTYTFSADAARSFSFAGGGGNDTFTCTCTSVDDRATLSPTAAQVTSSNYDVSATGFSLITLYSAGGSDTVSFYDSAGDDDMLGDPFQAWMAGANYRNVAYGFATVNAYATAGGVNNAYLYDSVGDDFFLGDATAAKLWGQGFYLAAHSFTMVDARAYCGGRDEAYLYDSAGNDILLARPAITKLYGTGYCNLVRLFEYVDARAYVGGRDEAYLYDSSGNDILLARPGYTQFWGTGYYIAARNFGTVDARAYEGGRDEAYLYDSAGDDYLVITPEMARLWGTGFNTIARKFAYMDVRAYGGGRDTATFYDSARNDAFSAGAQEAWFNYGTGQFAIARTFDSVEARSTSGGSDRAMLYDSSSDDVLTLDAQYACMMGIQYCNTARGFQQITAIGSGGVNLLDRRSVDVLFQALGVWQE